MNYYTAKELQRADGEHSGLFHYTCTNDGRTYPVGYCSGNCEGHPTADEAREHYKKYLLDQAKYDAKLSDMQRPCEVCGEWTQLCAEIAFEMELHPLCDAHRNREELSKLVVVGDAWSSY